MSYSPHLRTAVLLSGSGTAGPITRACSARSTKSGIKIDVMSGRGMGAAGALFAAIDAAPKMWETGGVWRRTPPVRLYRLASPSLLGRALLTLLAAAVLLLPLLVLATGLIAYPLSFLVQMISIDRGHR